MTNYFTFTEDSLTDGLPHVGLIHIMSWTLIVALIVSGLLTMWRSSSGAGVKTLKVGVFCLVPQMFLSLIFFFAHGMVIHHELAQSRNYLLLNQRLPISRALDEHDWDRIMKLDVGRHVWVSNNRVLVVEQRDDYEVFIR